MAASAGGPPSATVTCPSATSFRRCDHTLIPAAFVTYLPIEALRTLSLGHAGLALLGSLAVLAAGVLLFYTGLRRYESGNLMEMRG